MRYRVDFEHGYASYDEKDKDRAFEIYREMGIRIRLCKDIHDEGTPIEGRPIFVDLTREIATNAN